MLDFGPYLFMTNLHLVTGELLEPFTQRFCGERGKRDHILSVSRSFDPSRRPKPGSEVRSSTARIMQNVDFRYDARVPEGISVSHYLQQKVWLPGFRFGRKDSVVWVTDPWDATY
jgi:hypothetical protein